MLPVELNQLNLSSKTILKPLSFFWARQVVQSDLADPMRFGFKCFSQQPEGHFEVRNHDGTAFDAVNIKGSKFHHSFSR